MQQEEKEISSIQQHEDAALKESMRFFAEELLPFWGIEGTVVGFAPTELIHLELKKFFQDFNLIMDDGSWKHFEFQSTNEGVEGLRRFRTYEALASYQYQVPITTYVLFSGTIRHPITELKEGVNTYRIVPIIMQEDNVDDLFTELCLRVNEGEMLNRKDLIPLTLCMLMGGQMPQRDRARTAFSITSNAKGVSQEDISKIEAVVYVMADKFLDGADMEELKEEIHLTKIGRMMYEDGIEEGMKRGKEYTLERVNKLYHFLICEKKYDELEKATVDHEYQEELFKMYGIS